MKAMEQRAPRIAAFATTVAGMSFIAMLGNAFLGRYPGQDGQRVLLRPLFEGFVSGEKNDYWASTGWATQEWIWLVLSICLGLLAVWCRQARPVPELPKQRSVAEQIADFESSATNVGTRSVASVTTNTSSIISSIVGETKSVDARKVESATALLSSGALGSYAASIVSERNSDIESRTFESEPQSSEPDEVIVENRDFISEGPAYIPLPGKEDQKEIQSLFREPNTEFVSDGPAHIPLPELPELEEPVSLSLPEMPDLDDLLESDDTVPSLPNLDDLF